MVHAAKQVIRVADDLMTALPFDVRDEADAAAVVLGFGPVKAARLGGSCFGFRVHIFTSRSRASSMAEWASAPLLIVREQVSGGTAPGCVHAAGP